MQISVCAACSNFEGLYVGMYLQVSLEEGGIVPSKYIFDRLKKDASRSHSYTVVHSDDLRTIWHVVPFDRISKIFHDIV